MDLDEVAQLDDILDGESGPTSQVVRGFRVCWSDGRALDVACLVSVDDWGSSEHEAVGFGLSEDAALAALAEGSAAIIGESNDECWTQTHTDELAEAFDAANLVLVQMSAGRRNRAGIREGLLDTRAFPGATGVLTMHPNGNARRRPFLLRVSGRRVVPLD